MQKLQSHIIKDIWRVREGLLIEINKYKAISTNGIYFRDSEIKKKKVKGCKNLWVMTEEYVAHTYDKSFCMCFPTGTYLYHYRPIIAVTDPNLFSYEIKSSGGSIYGTVAQIERVLSDIKKIMNSYDEGDKENAEV